MRCAYCFLVCTPALPLYADTRLGCCTACASTFSSQVTQTRGTLITVTPPLAPACRVGYRVTCAVQITASAISYRRALTHLHYLPSLSMGITSAVFRLRYLALTLPASLPAASVHYRLTRFVGTACLPAVTVPPLDYRGTSRKDTTVCVGEMDFVNHRFILPDAGFWETPAIPAGLPASSLHLVSLSAIPVPRSAVITRTLGFKSTTTMAFATITCLLPCWHLMTCNAYTLRCR